MTVPVIPRALRTTMLIFAFDDPTAVEKLTVHDCFFRTKIRARICAEFQLWSPTSSSLLIPAKSNLSTQKLIDLLSGIPHHSYSPHKKDNNAYTATPRLLFSTNSTPTIPIYSTLSNIYLINLRFYIFRDPDQQAVCKSIRNASESEECH